MSDAIQLAGGLSGGPAQGLGAGGDRARANIEPRQRYAWSGPSLLVTDARGECGTDDHLTGYFFREARHLRRLQLLVNGVAPWMCAEGAAGDRSLTFVYVHPELTEFGGGGTDVSDDTTWRDERGLAQRSIDLRLRYDVLPDGLVASLTLCNRAREAATLDLEWALDADFADVQEAFSGARQQQSPVLATADGPALTFRYDHASLPLATALSGQGAPWRANPRGMSARVELVPQRALTVQLRVRPEDPTRERPRPGALEAAAQWRSRLPAIHTPGDTSIGEMVNQAAHDLGSLALLDGPPDEWLAIQAGIPLYPALFGRDAITVGWQATMLDRGEMLDAALTRLGRLQSDRTVDWSDEQPGRIPYQVRTGPLARLGFNPYAAYYADFASPLMFVISLAHHFAWSGDRAVVRRHWDTARRILDWARTLGDPDGDGYLEYETRSPKGTKNQGWKDSGNAILYEDGRPVPAPLGTCDLQGYWFAAQQLAAALSLALGQRDDARDHWRSAMALKDRFNRDWWMEEEGFIALAMDRDKRLARSITSNVGQCLATGIIDDEHLPRVVGRLYAPDLFSGWGIRTLSTEHPAYNPLGYHLGTVWPVENATTLFGLRRFGFDARAQELAEGMFALARLYALGRVPECVGGYARGESPNPGAYPRANPTQAWNQSGLVLVLQSLLGLQPAALLHTLFVDPALPAWLPEVVVRGLRLGEASASLRFWRDASGASHAEVLESHGPFHLVRQPPPESLSAGVRDRLGALVDGMVHH